MGMKREKKEWKEKHVNVGEVYQELEKRWFTQEGDKLWPVMGFSWKRINDEEEVMELLFAEYVQSAVETLEQYHVDYRLVDILRDSLRVRLQNRTMSTYVYILKAGGGTLYDLLEDLEEKVFIGASFAPDTEPHVKAGIMAHYLTRLYAVSETTLIAFP